MRSFLSARTVQRTFPDGLEIPVAEGGAEICRTVVKLPVDQITEVRVLDPYFYA
jgi:hypothetical protein